VSVITTRARAARLASAAVLTTALLATTGTAAQARETGDPFGHFGEAIAVDGGVEVRGWAWDPSRSGATSVKVKAGSVTKTIKADQKRSDVARVHPSAGTHRGFTATIALPGGKHQVCLTALNEGWGSDKDLGCKTVTVAGSQGGGKPGAHNTGVPTGTKLKVHQGDLRVREAGKVIDGLDVRGFVFIEAPNVVVRNSIVRGGPTGSTKGLIHATNSAASVLVEDTELSPSTPSSHINGLHGANITARRVNIHGVIDSAHLYGAGNVTIEDSWLHDNQHFTNDPAWGGKPSHDDSIQIVEGSNYRFRNNTITGATNTGIQLTQDRGKVSQVTITGNWLDGGGCTINFAEKNRGAFSGVTITGNTFGRNTKHDNCAIIAPTPTREKLTVNANTYVDGKAVSVTKG